MDSPQGDISASHHYALSPWILKEISAVIRPWEGSQPIVGGMFYSKPFIQAFHFSRNNIFNPGWAVSE